MAINRLYLVVCASLAITQAVADVVVDTAVLEAVAAGRARVIVELNISGGFSPVGELTEKRARAQTEAIAASQETVLLKLAGTDAELIRRQQTAPFLAFELGANALEVLRSMPELVIRIFEDRAAVAEKPE